jgi:thiamine pyrophosphokinase
MTTETGEHHALVLADGEVATRADLDAAWPGWDDEVAIVVAADGGARHARALGVQVDRWVGDGDSIASADLGELAARGVHIERASADKDESDTELAVLDAVAAGATRVSVLGALGGKRLDHALANLALLAHPALAGTPVTLYDERAARVTLVDARLGAAAAVLGGRAGDLVSLIPLGDVAAAVRTVGLRYPLDGEDLGLGPARGLSNVRTAPTCTIEVGSGRLLVIETPATLAG